MNKVTSICLRGILVAGCALALSGCGTIKSYQSAKIVEERKYDKPDPAKDKFVVDMAKRYGLMALFAQTAYREDLPIEARYQKACSEDGSASGSSDDVLAQMPRQLGAKHGWERWRPQKDRSAASPSPVKACADEGNGLFYETYVYRGEDEKITTAVIAFRGTENLKGQWLQDWKTNLSAAFGFEPSQYTFTRTHIPALIEGLRIEGGSSVRIYAVGHSLGGGLAQQAAYLSESIDEAFVFNASPVTGWTYLVQEGALRKPYPKIHRITHGGEALELPRFVAGMATDARYGRNDVRIHIKDADERGDHSMRVLTCGFAEVLLREEVGDADHHYPLDFIAAEVLTTKRKHDMNLPIKWQNLEGGLSRVCDPPPKKK